MKTINHLQSKDEQTIPSVGQKWVNTESRVDFWITNIDKTLISLDDRKKKLSSVEHMNKMLWRHLVDIGVFKRIG